MLTRIEIDGFKSFSGVSVDLQPLSVIVGPNAAGKSNFFDALRLLSRLCQFEVRTAFQEIRGDSAELFRTSGSEVSNKISISVEVLLPQYVEDPYGLKHKLIQNRVRYSISIARRIEENSRFERLFVVHECAEPIPYKQDRWISGPRPPTQNFRRKFASSRRKSNFLETTVSDSGDPIFLARQDRTQGRGRAFPASRAETSVLSGITSAAEFPHLYALRSLLSNVRYLQLDPALERNPSSFLASEHLEPDGSNLAAVLARLQDETKTEKNAKGVIVPITQALKTIIPGIKDLEVVSDEIRREHRLEVMTADGIKFSSRVLTDGTLRVISILTLIYDLRFHGVVCFEEPENGIHEYRIKQLVSILRDSCQRIDSKLDLDHDKNIQFIVNTHSPIVMKTLDEHELIYADTVSRVGKGELLSRSTRMRSGASKRSGDDQFSLTRFEIDQILHREDTGV